MTLSVVSNLCPNVVQSGSEHQAHLRIGELARRTGVATELLRAWEPQVRAAVTHADALRLSPLLGERRTPCPADARAARDGPLRGRGGRRGAERARGTGRSGLVERCAARAARGARALRRRAAHAAFDRLLADLSLDAVLDGAVLPLLHEFGDRWAAGELTVAQEHFASHLIRGRLLGLARGWDRGAGPRAVLACPPGEQHDLALIVFGIALREQGWRVTFLGADTPVDLIVDTVGLLRPAALVLAAVERARLEAMEPVLQGLPPETAVWFAGAGADEDMAERCGARLLDLAPVAAAAWVAAGYELPGDGRRSVRVGGSGALLELRRARRPRHSL